MPRSLARGAGDGKSRRTSVWLATAPEAGGRAAVRIVADRVAEIMGRAEGDKR